MDYLLQQFGDISLSSVIIFIAAIVFLVKCWEKFYKKLMEHHDGEQEKDETLNKISTSLEEVIKEQKNLRDAILELKSRQQEIAAQQSEYEQQAKQYNLNRLKDILLQNYRYYTDEKKNPICAWTEMEKDAFDNLFKDYEKMGGNGFMHSVVEPAMNALDVIPMVDSKRINELMSQRNG